MIELMPEVTCDGCANTFDYGNSETSAAAARRMMKTSPYFVGWKMNKHGDFCPKCVSRKRHLKPSFLVSLDD
jgi:hypothetical protein